VPTMIGVDQRQVSKQIQQLLPDFMAMGEKGMHEMARMEMPLPDNTVPMMTGQGPFGPVGMGGMFSVLKVRQGLKSGDYSDPGWFKHPTGSQAHEWTGHVPTPTSVDQHGAGSMPMTKALQPEVEVGVRKPGGSSKHAH
jgi:hypothetical protein